MRYYPSHYNGVPAVFFGDSMKPYKICRSNQHAFNAAAKLNAEATIQYEL